MLTIHSKITLVVVFALSLAVARSSADDARSGSAVEEAPVG
jgi:hypothetical protein